MIKNALTLPMIKEYPETHQTGVMEINAEAISASIELIKNVEDPISMDCDFGIQISSDGRIWVCINGVALIRFKPKRRPL